MVRRIVVGGLIAFAASCGGDSSGPGAGSVEIADLVMTPTTPQCRSNITGSNYTLLAEVHVINTTAQDITVTKVASNGVVIAATAEADLGTSWHTYATLPYTPDPALVRARDGDLKLRITMVVQCGVWTLPNQESYKDVLTSVSVTTSAGQYTAPSASIRVIARPF